jgi:hypothetical protein
LGQLAQRVPQFVSVDPTEWRKGLWRWIGGLVIHDLADCEVGHDEERERHGDEGADEVGLALAFDEIADGGAEEIDLDHGGHAGGDFDKSELAMEREKKSRATGDGAEKNERNRYFEIQHRVTGIQITIMYRGW